MTTRRSFDEGNARQGVPDSFLRSDPLFGEGCRLSVEEIKPVEHTMPDSRSEDDKTTTTQKRKAQGLTIFEVVDEHVNEGASLANLGASTSAVPLGYAILMNADGTHFFWVCEDGRESVICWDRWAVLRSANNDAKKRKAKS